MNQIEIKVINAIQHITNTARFNSYKKQSHEKIAELLDQADYLFNLLKDPDQDIVKIKRVLQSILEKYPECSTMILNLE